MLRELDMNEISDGRRYSASDRIRCDTRGCEGCHECCRVTGDTIILDPYDAALLCMGLECDFDALLEHCVGLRPVDGLILPYLAKKQDGNCAFLDENGRCAIHPIRPGFCRLFPLGRIYDRESESFSYYLQVHECPRIEASLTQTGATKASGSDRKDGAAEDGILIREWIGMEDMDRYESFIAQWHFLTVDLVKVMTEHPEEEFVKKLCMATLNLFYRRPYGRNGQTDFFAEFDERVKEIREILA